ncbi:procollagen-lysine,2-oxoglutarate 5-dioxygenase [Loa loa]|uniref:procollagen-lysine 5-dioxygenase n=1 Tax=Loa loa TaxID=7209 RepID=A0A1I7VBN3_LOALO|nr:procollagen-lysine,2-oxoglutarate 5-dioxygenase [Loa loa]EJD75866.1 procollagen-lysine,2-oxoglutarate 5-dioxygenase [Loa loa]
MTGLWVLTLSAVSMCRIMAQEANNVPKLLVVTVATEETDGLRRLKRTAHTNHFRLEVFGMGEEWRGGNTRVEQGGGQKIRILRKSLGKYKDRDDLIILFVDAYDVILLGNEEQILRKFFTFFNGFRVVFSSEPFCWPNRNLAPKYPLVNFGHRYLNSGVFMGFAPEIWSLISYRDVEDNDDDQLYYTRLYLDKQIRLSLKMTLDSMTVLFQNLNGASNDVKLEMSGERSGMYFIYNFIYNTHPLVIHGNGPSKLYLNHLGNYIDPLRIATSKTQSITMDFEKIELPKLFLSIIISKPIPFIREFFGNIKKLAYTDEKIDLFVYCNQKFLTKEVSDFVEDVKKRYRSLLYDDSTEMEEREARSFSLKQSLALGDDYLIMVDGDVHLNNSEALLFMVHTMKEKEPEILAPLIRQPHKLFTNFWGAISSNGYYARSENYLDIIDHKEVGIWNVPFIGSILIIAKEKLTSLSRAYHYDEKLDPDMSFCSFARDKGHFLYLDNSHHYGFLVVSENVESSKVHPEMYEIFNNKELWEKRYIHPNYFTALNGSTPIPEICQDVYDFPLMSERFCAELIEECEYYGKWSDGKHKDERLVGGYENVPTRDIHMKQIDFERHWLYMLDEYVRPIQEKLFIGYYKQPVESVMMFVVRYKPEEQASLRPHHDASTYSIDIALNKRGVDYEGGGVRFLRYNCTFDADVVGHSMIFPGRLTHLHEGLETTRGTRYIAVSFINP